VRLDGPGLRLRVAFASPRLAGASGISLQVIRAGEVLSGMTPEQSIEIFGWHSPTYNLRLPALSLRWTVQSSVPLVLETTLLSIYP
jgi:hypothetical protein